MTEPEPVPESLADKAGEVESYGGVPMSDEELGEAWTGSETGTATDAEVTGDDAGDGADTVPAGGK